MKSLKTFVLGSEAAAREKLGSRCVGQHADIKDVERRSNHFEAVLTIKTTLPWRSAKSKTFPPGLSAYGVRPRWRVGSDEKGEGRPAGVSRLDARRLVRLERSTRS
jgi:hypothetical protein